MLPPPCLRLSSTWKSFERECSNLLSLSLINDDILVSESRIESLINVVILVSKSRIEKGSLFNVVMMSMSFVVRSALTMTTIQANITKWNMYVTEQFLVVGQFNGLVYFSRNFFNEKSRCRPCELVLTSHLQSKERNSSKKRRKKVCYIRFNIIKVKWTIFIINIVLFMVLRSYQFVLIP